MRRPTAAHVDHARVDGADGDAPPEPVVDAKLAFRHQVAQVARQPGPWRCELLHPVDHAVIALDDRVGGRMTREPPERDAHTPTMRSSCPASLTIFGGTRRTRAVRPGARTHASVRKI